MLSIIRSNAYIAYKTTAISKSKKPISHKKFSLRIIHYLMHCAQGNDSAENSLLQTPILSPSPTMNRPKRRCVSPSPVSNKKKSTNKNEKTIRRNRSSADCSVEVFLQNFYDRKNFPNMHLRIQLASGKSGACVMCSFLYLTKKKRGNEVVWDKEVKRTSFHCLHCTEHNEDAKCCFLCKQHFAAFHKNRPFFGPIWPTTYLLQAENKIYRMKTKLGR